MVSELVARQDPTVVGLIVQLVVAVVPDLSVASAV